MAYQLEFSGVHATDAHVGTPEQVVEIHYELKNTGPVALPAAGAFVTASGFGGDRMAEASHWVHEEIPPGGSKSFVVQLQCDPGDWQFSLMAFDANQAWITNTDNIAHAVAGYPGAEHHQARAQTDATYWLTLSITSVEDIDGGVRVHYSAKNDGTADAPPGLGLFVNAGKSDTDFADWGSQVHVLESAVPVGLTIHGYLTVMLEPGHYHLRVEGASGTNSTPAIAEATIAAP